MANLPLGNPVLRWFSRKVMPLVPLSAVDGVMVERVKLEHARLIIYRPETRHTDAALLWIHGGGYLGGAPLQDHEFCAVTARELGMVVVSVQYRLSPEPVFERAHPDCMESWAWMQKESASLGINAGRVVVGGQSAGGGLAAGVVQHSCDKGPGRPFGQWLFCPMLDDRTATRSDLGKSDHLVWNNGLNAIGWQAYLGQSPGGKTTPDYAVPARRVDLSTLPATWLGIGDIDLFYEEDRLYAERIEASGVPTELVVVPGGPHGFERWAADTEIAVEYLAKARDWLRRLVA